MDTKTYERSIQRVRKEIESCAQKEYQELKAQASTYGKLEKLVREKKDDIAWNYAGFGRAVGDCLYGLFKNELRNLPIQPEGQKRAELGCE